MAGTLGMVRRGLLKLTGVPAGQLLVDSCWLRTVAPATAWLRFAMLFAILGAGWAHIQVHWAVAVIAAGVGCAYAALYGAVLKGRISGAVLAYAGVADGILAGVMLRAAGGWVAPVALLALVVLATAQIGGGWYVVSLAGAGIGGGYAAGWLSGVGTLIGRSELPLPSLAGGLEVETAYGGVPLSLAGSVPVAHLAVGAFVAICVAVGLVLWRTYREDQGIKEELRRAEALEAVVDCGLAGGAPDVFWQTVCHAAAACSGAQAYIARADGENVYVCAEGGGAARGGGVPAWHAGFENLRVPLGAVENPLVRCLTCGATEETADIETICGGTQGRDASGGEQQCRIEAGAILLAIPTEHAEAVLVAVASRISEIRREWLRAVAERAALVLHATRAGDQETQRQAAGLQLGTSSDTNLGVGI